MISRRQFFKAFCSSALLAIPAARALARIGEQDTPQAPQLKLSGQELQDYAKYCQENLHRDRLPSDDINPAWTAATYEVGYVVLRDGKWERYEYRGLTPECCWDEHRNLVPKHL